MKIENTDQNNQEEETPSKNESQRLASEDQGSHNTDNFVKMESD